MAMFSEYENRPVRDEKGDFYVTKKEHLLDAYGAQQAGQAGAKAPEQSLTQSIHEQLTSMEDFARGIEIRLAAVVERLFGPGPQDPTAGSTKPPSPNSARDVLRQDLNTLSNRLMVLGNLTDRLYNDL